MALVLLKTGIVHPGQPGAPKDIDVPYIDHEQMTTAQKLLLFWRKPAVSLRFATSTVSRNKQGLADGCCSAEMLVGRCRGRDSLLEH